MHGSVRAAPPSRPYQPRQVRPYCTVRTRVLLVPPLLHPTSPDPPLGVVALTCTGPGPEITPVVSVTFICWLLGTDAASVFPLTTNSVDETNWLPFTVSTTPCSTCANVTLLGASDPIAGTGRALPHSGFRVLLQPGRTINSSASDRPPLRDSITSLPSLSLSAGSRSSSLAMPPSRDRPIICPFEHRPAAEVSLLPKSPQPVPPSIIFFAFGGSF